MTAMANLVRLGNSIQAWLFLRLEDVLLIANWLAEKGVPEKANWLRENFLTGTAITVIIALLILLVSPGRSRIGIGRSYPVCDKRLFGNPNYCAECGSKVA